MRHAPLLAFLLCLLHAAAASSHAQTEPRQRPNILVIMADDHAAHALSCYGSTINTTPNLDRLAEQGARFTNAFCTNAICTPMRAVILTGMYSHKNGVMDNDDPLPKDAVTLADLFGAAGYQTAIIGKWHLHRTPTGFTHYDILPGQGEYIDPEFITAAGKKKHGGYVTDITFDKAMDWIRARETQKPFLLFCHLKAPHRPWQPDEKHASMYADTPIPLPATFDDDHATRTAAARLQTMTIERHLTRTDTKADPPPGLDPHALKVWNYQRFIKDYLRCIASIDDNVGRLMAFLDEQKLADDTILVYCSDQGFFLGDHGWYDKRFMYEESLRFPLIIRYPREIQPGTISDAMVLSLDYAPTFLDFAGIRAPDIMQGISFREAFRGNPRFGRGAIYYHYYESGEPHTVPKHYGVRTPRYKLIRFYELPGGDAAQWELYDLQNDPDEMKNIYRDPLHANVLEELKQTLKHLRESYEDTTGAPLP